MKPTRDQLDKAARHLSIFVMRMAHLFEQSMGFPYVAVPNAPETLCSLRVALDKCKAGRGKVSFPVWDGASDGTIYEHPDVNYAFRFWHDMIHLSTGLGMTLEDEVKVGMMQAERVGLHFGMDSLEYKLMVADTCGQSVYHAMHGHFPVNQREWAYATVMNQQ